MTITVLFSLALVLGACSYEATTDRGTVEIRATDAPPTGVSSIVVTVDNIQVHKSGTDADSWITVVDSEKTFDLVDIQGAEVFLGDEDVEAGQYTQIRLDVTGVTVTLEGAEVSAELPSDKLKVVRNWQVVAGETTILTLDFEADEFVVVTGADRVQVKPVLKLEVTQGDRPLKTAAETDGEEDEETEPPPAIPHTLEGRDDCMACHGEDGLKPVPTDHADRGNEGCQGCHQP